MEKSKRNKLVRLILPLLILFSLLLTGCEQYNLFGKNDKGDENKDSNSENDNNTTEDEKESSGLESGFTSSSDPGDGMHAAYRSDKTEFDIDDVTLEFFYGGYYSSEIDIELFGGNNYPSFDICFDNDEGDHIIVKSVNENFVSEKYRCYYIYDEDWYIREVKYNHSETLTIPKEIFTKKTGIIWFATYGENVGLSKPKYQPIASTYIHYKIVGDKVFLSNKPFE